MANRDVPIRGHYQQENGGCELRYGCGHHVSFADDRAEGPSTEIHRGNYEGDPDQEALVRNGQVLWEKSEANIE